MGGDGNRNLVAPVASPSSLCLGTDKTKKKTVKKRVNDVCVKEVLALSVDGEGGRGRVGLLLLLFSLSRPATAALKAAAAEPVCRKE